MSCVDQVSAGEALLSLGWQISANQYRLVHLAAEFDEGLEWWRQGVASAALWISQRLQVQSATAREWIRVGHELRYLPLIDAAWAAQDISYAKVRILTRWADEGNEHELLTLARERSANRLSAAIAKSLADGGESDDERDERLHEARSFTTWTDGDGMTVMRVVLPPSVSKPVVAAIDELVRKIAATSLDDGEAISQPSADDFCRPYVVEQATQVAQGGRDPSADGSGGPEVATPPRNVASVSGEATQRLGATLRDLRRRWQPAPGGQDAWVNPSLAQQRADAFVALFLGFDVGLVTEVVFHVRGDGITFDDGTPTTKSAVMRLLDQSFVRLLIHDAKRRPINASGRQRLPTARQRRVVMEAHGHECVDCQSTDLVELDHNPPWERTRRTVIDELEPRCAPCHRARHRFDAKLPQSS